MKFSDFKNQTKETLKNKKNGSSTRLNTKNLEIILDTIRSINNTLILEDVLTLVIRHAIQITNSDRGFIVLLNENGDLEFKIGLDDQGNLLSESAFNISTSVVKDVFISSQSRFIESAQSDTNYDRSKSILQLELQTILCSPLKTQDEKIGVIYVDSKKLQHVKVQEITDTFEILAGQAAIAIKNAQLYYDQIISYREIQKTNNELLKAKEKVEISDRIKSEFLAQMSHEIRTPINIIVNFLQMLKEESQGKDGKDIEEYFDVINSASLRITRTIDLILNMSEIHVGTYNPVFANFDLNNIVDKINREFRLLAKQKDLDFSVIKRFESSFVFADEYSVHQIINNLLDNAIKFTEKGKVEIIVDKNKDGKTILLVSDTGIGISKEFLPNLFNPFSQEVQGYTKKYEGTGLGLALIKKYCELNDAQIEVSSKKGLGTTFTIIFN
jgi:signal transduction histidine kinase